MKLGAFSGSENITDDGEQQAHDHARSDTLYAAKNDELQHAVAGDPGHLSGAAAKCGCNYENDRPR